MTIRISEVGPRDGLQSIAAIISTHQKCRWIDALADAGLTEIEVGSFVPKDLFPQLADTAEIVQHARRRSNLCVVALTANLRGAKDALHAGVHKVTIPVSASVAHSRANLRKSPDDMVKEVRIICETVSNHNSQPKSGRVSVEVGISTAFGCTIEGPVPEDRVIRLAKACADAGADSVGLSDTTGMANPTQIGRLFGRLRSELGDKSGAAHLHNTRGLGLANALAAYEVGVDTFDSSLAGLGGCPYAPGASGNIVTEDLIYMFEAMGVRTGVSFEGLLQARRILSECLPDEPLYGMTPLAGLPKGFSGTLR
jgi:hydroxymethylglutaryl-CoA lyase